jgi:hypothetical protein
MLNWLSAARVLILLDLISKVGSQFSLFHQLTLNLNWLFSKGANSADNTGKANPQGRKFCTKLAGLANPV